MVTESCQSVLIVDDDAFLGGLIQRMLKNAGVEHSTLVADGMAALRELAANRHDLMLCDLNMPGMDGLELIRHLADLPASPPLVLMSDTDRRILGTARQLARAQGLNVLGILNKPVSAGDLREMLDLAVSQRHPQRAFRAVQPLTADQIRHGIAYGYVRAHYQPKVSAQNGSVSGVEALLRWQDPQSGPVPPVAIVPVAEREGLMLELTGAILKAVLADAPRLLDRHPKLTLAVNISADNLNDLAFPEQVISLSQAAGVPLSALMLEVTESKLIENIARPVEILTRLRLKGVGLSIDDYGTGASTLQQLQRLPATELKIDRIFVNGATSDLDSLAMLESSVDLARKLGLSVVAEGVESQEEMELIQRAGCDLAQGFYIQKALALEPLLDWIAQTRH